MKSFWAEQEIKYTGEQLTSHWAFYNFNLAGDSIVSFMGPCQIEPRYLTSVEHYQKKSQIKSKKMLHFVVEHFDSDLENGVLRQKLLISILKDKLNHRLKGDVLQKWGDDIFDADAKLTISSITKTNISIKIHLGVNISDKDTPVKTKGLENYGIDPAEIAQAVMNQYRLDMKRVEEIKAGIRSLE
jgi:hypothetical protein